MPRTNLDCNVSSSIEDNSDRPRLRVRYSTQLSSDSENSYKA